MKPENWIYEGDRQHVRRRFSRGIDRCVLSAVLPVLAPIGNIAEEFRSGATIDALAAKHKVSGDAIEAVIRTCMRARRARP